jgi:hypothetical protein
MDRGRLTKRLFRARIIAHRTPHLQSNPKTL